MHRETARGAYNLEEIVGSVVAELKVQLLDKDQLHPVDVSDAECAAVVANNVGHHCLHRLQREGKRRTLYRISNLSCSRG